MTFCLDTTIIKPLDNAKIQNAVVLLHGYGGDGGYKCPDIKLKRHLPNTVFICPMLQKNVKLTLLVFNI